jgi:hypothetical protein
LRYKDCGLNNFNVSHSSAPLIVTSNMKSIARYVAAAAIPAVLASPLVARDNGTAQTGFANVSAYFPCY